MKMHNLRNYLLFGLLALIIHGRLPAQSNKAWTLEECINYARSRNINVKKQLLNVQLQKDQLNQSKLATLPTLNGNASHVYNWGQTIDPFTNQFATERVRSNNFYISTQMTLFNGFQKLNTIRRNQLALRISEIEVERMMNDISLNVVTFYLQGLYAIEVLKNAENQLELVRQQRERIAQLVEAGTLARGELLNMDAQVAAAELQEVEARNNFDIALLQLAQLIDLENPESFTIKAPDISIPEGEIPIPEVEGVVSYALAHQPEIISSEMRKQQSEKDYEVARGGLSPVLSLGGSWGTGYSGAAREIDPDIPPTILSYPIGITQNSQDTVRGYTTQYSYRIKPFKDQLKANENKSFGLYLNIPIFNGYRVRNSIQQARIARESAELDLQLARNNLRKLITQAHADAQAALKKYHSARRKMEAQEESFHYASEKYAVGLLTAVEYNQNKEDLNKARSELLQAKYDFIFKTRILDFYQGKPIVIE
ncbi:MAG: TolC family protein [Bacteroidales bacterium]|nr:TolC family protein [Bacteroidales bacterium]NPV35402.1 TolC family protein [Bacteroidales bacterium]